ncbi:MAG: NADH-quinone oxidoreductase subunit NuoG [Fimbriimonadaceae bacterium]|nr:NADH-quinone oxidoreductase subunit NuoG [Fimbriimonadaceae bacterium]
MAAVTEIPLVNITVNDVPLAVPKGELIVESVKRLGIEIPIFCYHPRMKPVGMCRMCLIEIGTKAPDGSIRMMPKPQAACSLPASEGLVIVTDSEKLHRDRKGVLEFLLINHPLDCPICDRGGECPLQNNTLFYGPSTSRFVEMKRHSAKAFPLSQYVTLDLERCIQCGRCVRFTEEISGDAQLAFRFRGAAMQPSTFQLTDFESKFSGNTIEICPVGALTSKKYRFRARPWDLQTKPGICTLCSNGCNVHMDYRQGELVRINGRTNEAVNEEWTCDKGKFGHDIFNAPDRLTQPMTRQGDRLVPTGWAEAYGELLGAFRDGGSRVAAIAGGALSNEDYFVLRQLFRDGFGSPHTDHRFERELVVRDHVTTKIAEFENRRRILVFATSLADELPILYLRVRKAATQFGAEVVVISEHANEVDAFAKHAIRIVPGSEATVARAITGSISADYANELTGVAEATLETVREWAKGATIITSRGIYDADRGAEAVDVLAEYAAAHAGELNVYARRANEEGATQIGFLPGPDGADTHGILRAAAAGELSALWVVGVDLFAVGLPAETVTAALENVPYLVVQDWRPTETTAFASVVLPMTAPMEAEGSYTNLERRVQHQPAVLAAKGQAKPAWRAASELQMRLRPMTPFFSAEDVLRRVRADVPSLA